MDATCSFTKPFRGVTRNSSNDSLRTFALESNIEQDLARSEEIHKILKTAIVGQLGGYCRDLPFNEDEVRYLLHSDVSDLKEKWETKQIANFNRSLEFKEGPFAPSYEDVGGAKKVALEG